MSPAVQAAIISALTLLVLALSGVIWKLYERLIQVEALALNNKEKIKEVDDRRHRYQVEARHEYNDLRNHIDSTLVGALRR